MPKCPFCDYKGPSKILADYGNVFVIEPIDPVTPGHVLVIPKKHVSDFATDDAYTTMEVARCASYYIRDNAIAPCNIISNVGREAGQTVMHMHLHIVPRRPGDGLQSPWRT